MRTFSTTSAALAAIAMLACGGEDSAGRSGPGATGGASGSSAGTSAGGTGAASGASGSSAQGGVSGDGGTGPAGAGPGGAAGTGPGGAGGGGASAGASGAGSYDEHAAEREGCVFGPGDPTTVTIGPNVPHGDALPFEHIIVLMMENRSFDHYFSDLPAAGVTDVDVAPANASNIDPDVFPAADVLRFHEPRYCIADVNHHWSGVHLQYGDGALDGFVATNNPGGARAMGYYDGSDLPYYYWLAQNFAMSDRHFCSLLGPTWPNRFYFYAATSWGNTKTGDLGVIIGGSERQGTLITEQLEQAGRSWRIYRDGLVSFGVLFDPIKYLGFPMTQLAVDVANDTLPDLAILDPNFTGSGQNDEHPPTNPQLGQELVERTLQTLMSNPVVWQKSVFVLLYDEHGGYYDHVAPPPACEPDNRVPPDWRFDRLGIRTPFFVVSPFAKRAYVSHTVTDITSVTRFIQNRFDLPAMTVRDANAWPMLDMFDFENPPQVTPPTGAPSGAATQAGKDWCAMNPPGTGLP